MNRVLQFIFVLFLFGCSRRLSSSGVIDDFGTYTSPDKSLSLVISKQGTSIVAFKIVSAKDGHSLRSDTIGSDAQRWCFYWDEKGRLWAYSSDTGYFSIFTAQPDATISGTEVDKGTQIPKPVYDFLPSSLKAHWGI